MKKITTEEFDKKFDDGESIIEHMDMSTLRRLHPQDKRVNVDFPGWMVNSLDHEATRLGVTRQSLIKMWLAEKLESRNNK